MGNAPDDASVQRLHIAVPCELEDRVDVSDATTAESWSVVTVCEESEYPPPILGRSAVLVYVDVVDDLGGSDLRKQIVTSLRSAGVDDEFDIFGRHCDDRIEVGGWAGWPEGQVDLGRIRVQC